MTKIAQPLLLFLVMGAAALAVGWRLAPRHSSTRIPSAVVDAQSLSADHLLGFMRHDSAVVSVLAMLAKRPGPSSRRLRRKPAIVGCASTACTQVRMHPGAPLSKASERGRSSGRKRGCTAGRREVAATPPTLTVRRYQQVPTPLVRDKVSNWRTGRLDLVMRGHSDTIGS